MSNNNSTLPILAVGALGLSSVSCAISSLTGFLVSDDSNVESNTNTDTSNTNTGTSNTNTGTSNTSTSNTNTPNTSTESDYAIPYQIELGTDGWCFEEAHVHQDVPGCGRICSSANLVASKMDGTWGPWADTTITCNGAKLDEIWEKQDDGTRKLADGYTVSEFPEGTLYYGGDSNLGRDGRNACNMTDDDRKYACDNDSELVGIGSGHTCGHKYYNTDQGEGGVKHISNTGYAKFYSCVKKDYV